MSSVPVSALPRESRRIHLAAPGSVPDGVLRRLYDTLLAGTGLFEAPVVVDVQGAGAGSKFRFLELSHPDAATIAIALGPLRIGDALLRPARPRDYTRADEAVVRKALEAAGKPPPVEPSFPALLLDAQGYGEYGAAAEGVGAAGLVQDKAQGSLGVVAKSAPGLAGSGVVGMSLGHAETMEALAKDARELRRHGAGTIAPTTDSLVVHMGDYDIPTHLWGIPGVSKSLALSPPTQVLALSNLLPHNELGNEAVRKDVLEEVVKVVQGLLVIGGEGGEEKGGEEGGEGGGEGGGGGEWRIGRLLSYTFPSPSDPLAIPPAAVDDNVVDLAESRAALGKKHAGVSSSSSSSSSSTALTIHQTLGGTPEDIASRLQLARVDDRVKDEYGGKSIVEAITGKPFQRKRQRRPEVPGLGKLFLEFDSAAAAARVANHFAGRLFDHRLVIASYLHHDAYTAGHLWGWGWNGATKKPSARRPSGEPTAKRRAVGTEEDEGAGVGGVQEEEGDEEDGFVAE